MFHWNPARTVVLDSFCAGLTLWPMAPVSAGYVACATMCEMGYSGTQNFARGGLGMIANVKARFSNGVLTPLEPLDLEEGDEVMVSIDSEPQRSYEERIRTTMSAAGGWEKDSEYWEQTKRMLYEARKTDSRIEASP